MLVLDTDAVTTIIDPRSSLYEVLNRRIRATGNDRVCTTAVTLEEQMRGRLAPLRRAKSAKDLIWAYAGLLQSFAGLCALEVIPYDSGAHDRFESLRRDLRRLNTLDLRIAATTLAHDATLLSRNLRDFRQVRGLRVEDWSK